MNIHCLARSFPFYRLDNVSEVSRCLLMLNKTVGVTFDSWLRKENAAPSRKHQQRRSIENAFREELKKKKKKLRNGISSYSEINSRLALIIIRFACLLAYLFVNSFCALLLTT
ncbi:hypothetical protein CEXT_414701 [Caerostris extrusa]|uniref:Uncharacterized protein n=1 Tax=Caerostris extrusa TaxID=172846 RepID=A0AAV4RCR0_CAEEX|nr:hypothetical protein CEXT_414701 [Caerostris extrusa]